MAKKFEFDYGSILDATAKKYALTIETYGGNRSEQSVSSGMLCTDLLLGSAGWLPGWHTSLGFEQSAKTTTAMMSLVEALKLDIPMIQVWDFEGSFDKNYVINFWNNTGEGRHRVTSDTFGVRNPDGSWKVKPRIPSYKVDTGEEFFTALHYTLKRMPKKQKIGDKWWLIFPKNKESKALVGSNYDEKMLRTMDCYAVEVPDGRPQGILMLDSYPTMNPELLDGDEGSKRMAAAASMFSDNMKRVKSMLSSRKVIVLGINQLRLKPGPAFGNPEYEPGGEALKLNSEIRIKHFPHSAPPNQFRVVGERSGINMLEKGVNGGVDTYKYIKLTTIKNKVGGAPAGSELYQRVWVADESGEARGLDPVFDAWQFMQLTGMISGNIRNFTWTPTWLKGVKVKKMSIIDLKVLMFGSKEAKQKHCKKFGIDKNPRVLDSLRAMLLDGSAYTMFKGGSVDVDDEGDDDDE